MAGKDNKQRTTTSDKQLLRALPSVSSLLEQDEVREWLHGLPRSAVVMSLKEALAAARRMIRAGRVDSPIELQDLLAAAEHDLTQRSIPSLRHVINATGIVLHTGLGRAPLCESAIEAIAETAGGYCNLEYNLESGGRGRRNTHVTERIVEVTGAEAATLVNNNAAATLLILQTFASDREVIVSRGQLIEIGGSFRLPDIMRAGQALLREVGTTNRTRIADYEQAITERTAMLLRCHPSNYRVVGFTEETSIGELSELAHRHDLIAVDDLGSGVLFDLMPHGLPAEPTVRASLDAGADLACFSGDKLMGGPQCGIIVGRRDLIDRLERNPLMRTYRVGKLTLVALEATLRCYIDEREAISEIPTLAMLTATTDDLAERANALSEQLQASLPDEAFLVCSDVAYAGGGSMPDRALPTVVVQWRPTHASTDDVAAALRNAEVPVIVRIRDDAICFDLRTIRSDDVDAVVASVTETVWDCEAETAARHDGPEEP